MEYDYREVLKRELERRCAVNALFSQRAFAKKLGMTQSGLSEVLAGRRGVSLVKARVIVERLGLSQLEMDMFCASVASLHARSPSARAAATSKLIEGAKASQFTQLSNDIFETIYQWHHLAILELTKVEGFQSDSAWIARGMGIGQDLVKESLSRLVRLGLLRLESGQYELTHKKLEFAGEIPSAAIKSFHSQILTKAQSALYHQEQKDREFSAVYIAIDSTDLPKAQTLLRESWRKFCGLMRDGKNKDKVYCLATQFFNIQETKP